MSDPYGLGMWVLANCVCDPKSRTASKTLYDDFARYRKEVGLPVPPPKVFEEELVEGGFHVIGKMIRGLVLREDKEVIDKLRESDGGPHLIECWFDGACEPKNPGGYASYGVIVKVDGRKVWEASK